MKTVCIFALCSVLLMVVGFVPLTASNPVPRSVADVEGKGIEIEDAKCSNFYCLYDTDCCDGKYPGGCFLSVCTICRVHSVACQRDSQCCGELVCRSSRLCGRAQEDEETTTESARNDRESLLVQNLFD